MLTIIATVTAALALWGLWVAATEGWLAPCPATGPVEVPLATVLAALAASDRTMALMRGQEREALKRRLNHRPTAWAEPTVGTVQVVSRAVATILAGPVVTTDSLTWEPRLVLCAA